MPKAATNKSDVVSSLAAITGKTHDQLLKLLRGHHLTSSLHW